MTRLIVAILVMALSSFAADINVTGDWTATAEGPNGPISSYVYIRSEGGKGHDEDRDDETGHAHSVSEWTGANQP